jgi:site-specific DNA-methyltransferase (adenine-specific)
MTETVYDDDGVVLVSGDASDYLAGYPGEPFDTVITDPPYGIGIKGLDGKVWDNGFPHPDFWRLLRERTGDGGLLACFCASQTVHRSANALEEAGWAVREIVAWIRPYAIGRKDALKRGWEAIIVASNGDPRPLNVDDARICGEGIPGWPSQELPDHNRALNIKRGDPDNRRETRSPSSVVIAAEDEGILDDHDRFFIVARATTREKGDYNTHPSVKPLTLIEHLILLLNPDDGLVFDPFVGSGTTLVAARRLGVPAIGVEVEPDYCEIAKRRLAETKNAIDPYIE